MLATASSISRVLKESRYSREFAWRQARSALRREPGIRAFHQASREMRVSARIAPWSFFIRYDRFAVDASGE
jgi:hypothetical protein